MSNRYKQMVSVLGVILLVFSACSILSSEPQATPAPQPTVTATATLRPSPTPSAAPAGLRGTVHLWHAWGERQAPILYQIVQDFRQQNPDVLFDILYIPLEDLREVYETQATVGRGPTLLMGPAEWGPSLYQAGVIAELGGLVDETLQANLNQPALMAAQYQDMLIGLPYTIRGVVLYRNKNLAPRRADTFEDFISLAVAATQGEQVGAVLERSFFYSGAHLSGLGGQLMDQDYLPAFNNANGLAWLELLKEFELVGPPNFFSGEDLDYFLEGKIAWMIDGTWNMPLLAESIGSQNLVIDPWPAYESEGGIDGYLSGYVQSDNLFINSEASGQVLEANLAFLEYFLSSDAQSKLTQVGQIPAARDVQVIDITTGHLFNEAMAALAGGTAYPVSPEMEIYAVQMDIALRAFFDGAAPEDALRAAEESIRRQIESLQVTPTPLP